MITKLERKGAPLMSWGHFLLRVAFSFLIALGITGFSLTLGTFGFRFFVPCEWLDALHNASMILAGMGPILDIQTVSGKLFSSFYALYCGIVYLTLIGIILAPFYHRMLHHFHLDEEPEKAIKKTHK